MHPTHKPHKQHLPLGIFFAVLAALCAALMGLMVKIIGDRATIVTSLFARYAISIVLILPWVLKRPKAAVIASDVKQLCARSFFTLLSVGGFFYALNFIPLANAIVLNNTSPLFIPIVVWFFFKIPTPHKAWIGLALGFTGVLMVLQPQIGGFQAASWIALASGATAAIAFVLIRSLTKTTPTLQILFYNFLVGLIASGLLLPFSYRPIHTDVFLPLVSIGIFGMGYQIFSTLALAKSPARFVTPFLYFSVVFGVFADYFYWHLVPGHFSLIGIVAIILGGSLTIFFSQKKS